MKKRLFIYLLSGLLLFDTGLHINEWRKGKRIEQVVSRLYDGEYDRNKTLLDRPYTGEKNNLQDVVDSVYDIMTITEFKIAGTKVGMRTVGNGSSIAIDERHIFTVYHAEDVDIDILIEMLGGLDKSGNLKGPMRVPAKSLVRESNKTYIRLSRKIDDYGPYKRSDKPENHGWVQLEEVVSAKDIDFAMLKLPDTVEENLHPFPYGFGKSSELDYGNQVIFVGNPKQQGFNMREGIVSMEETNQEDLDPHDYFVASAPLSPGDSGGPAFALRDGAFELVGLAKKVDKDNRAISFYVSIDSILDVIEEAEMPEMAAYIRSRMYTPQNNKF